MNPIALGILAACALAVLTMPRRLAPVGLLIGTCYVTRAQGIELGPFSFTVFRILIAVAAARILFRREWVTGGLRSLDLWMLAWGAWMIGSVGFHRSPGDQLIERLGLTFDAWGSYFFLRTSCQSWEDLTRLCRLLGFSLVPIAAEMAVEKATAHNFFSAFGGVSEVPTIRNGHVRAQGPFAHSILAGTIGAVCLPLVLSIWHRHKASAAVGAAACLTMVVASTSSGPILSAAAAIAALGFWPYRTYTRLVQCAAVAGYVCLALVMKDPPYFLLARIDLAGGSTGWHRSRLIQSSLEHLDEWWLYGTDYTRHWMASGVTWSPDHTDITNHYLQMGVLGGLPLMVLFLGTVITGFVIVGRGLRQSSVDLQFAIWALGASWCAHAATAISVSYFDQSTVFLYLTLALIGAMDGSAAAAPQGVRMHSRQERIADEDDERRVRRADVDDRARRGRLAVRRLGGTRSVDGWRA